MSFQDLSLSVSSVLGLCCAGLVLFVYTRAEEEEKRNHFTYTFQDGPLVVTSSCPPSVRVFVMGGGRRPRDWRAEWVSAIPVPDTPRADPKCQVATTNHKLPSAQPSGSSGVSLGRLASSEELGVHSFSF